MSETEFRGRHATHEQTHRHTRNATRISFRGYLLLRNLISLDVIAAYVTVVPKTSLITAVLQRVTICSNFRCLSVVLHRLFREGEKPPSLSNERYLIDVYFHSEKSLKGKLIFCRIRRRSLDRIGRQLSPPID